MTSDATRWAAHAGPDPGPAYAARFAQLQAAGAEIHGEAHLCAGLVSPPARVLDAGCGTGRVALRLAELGFRCVGVDVDASMLAQARAATPAGGAAVRWEDGDLCGWQPAAGERFDLVVAAGNVVPLLAAGTEASVLSRLGGWLLPGGRLVAGFGLDAGHLPRGAGIVELGALDAALAATGLALRYRWSSWDRASFEAGSGYAVSVWELPAGA